MGMHRDELQSFLALTPFFGGLDADGMDLVVALLEPRQLAAGDTVFQEGDRGASMFIVESGELLACQNGPSGRPIHLMRLRPGDFFGETTLIEMHPRPWTVTVERDAAVHELTAMRLYKLYKQDVRSYVLVLQNINRELCRRIRRAGNRITEVADESGDEATQIMSVSPLRGDKGDHRR